MGKDKGPERITPRAEDYSRWYTDVIREAELAEHAPVKGCMIIRRDARVEILQSTIGAAV